MLTSKKIEEIREHLEKAQNPIFFFDNDVDGFCSFIILKRAIGRGKGVAIKTYPYLNSNSLKKIDELNPDYVFVLDSSAVGEEFLEGIKERGLPLVVIDHHEPLLDKKILSEINYYNSFPSSEPTTLICHEIYKRKIDEWICLIGCTGDVYRPSFSERFSEENPYLYNNEITAFDCLYKTEIGKIALMINFGLKETTTNVLKMIYLFEKSNSPNEILEENNKTIFLHKKYLDMNKFVNKIIKKIERIGENKIFLEYSGQTSLSSEISNRIYLENRDKFIVVAFRKQDSYNVSLRGKNTKKKLLEVLKKIPGAFGGGHDEACGARIPFDSFEKFKEEILC